MTNRFILIFCFGLILSSAAQSQQADSVLNSLNTVPDSGRVSATFKSTRIVLSHSTETQKKYDLDMRIRHHFGDIGGEFGGSHTLYGLDVATDLYIGFDYGLTDRTTLGIGRSKQDELYNFFLKHKVAQQSEGAFPATITLLAQTGVIARKQNNVNEFSSENRRSTYFFQGMVSRKFSNRLSLQVAPGYLLRTMQTVEAGDVENIFALGFAGRFKLSKRLSFIGDYQLVNSFGRTGKFKNEYFNPLGVGLEIETGGHVFSLNFMNAQYIIENNFIAKTTKSWNDSGVRFGFTISRNFSLKRSKNPDIQSTIY